MQGVTAEEAKLLNDSRGGQASRHGPFPAALAQLGRCACQHLNDVICDASLGLQSTKLGVKQRGSLFLANPDVVLMPSNRS